MSTLHRFAITIAVAAICGSGCCLTQPCGIGGACGLRAAGGGPACDDGNCGLSSCDTCGVRGCLMGLACLGKLFNCPSCEGCGEVYYHEWISDPPPGKDPCNCQGKWTGVPWAGPCGDPTCTEGAVDIAYGAGVAPSDSIAGETFYTEPPYEATAPVVRDIGGRVGRGGGMQRPGRLLFATWTGMGGFVRNIGNGIFPYHGYAGYPGPCGGTVCDGRCGGMCGAGRPMSTAYASSTRGCTGCAAGCASCSVSAPGGQVIAQAVPTAPTHKVVSHDVRVMPGRPPHKVVSTRLRK